MKKLAKVAADLMISAHAIEQRATALLDAIPCSKLAIGACSAHNNGCGVLTMKAQGMIKGVSEFGLIFTITKEKVEIKDYGFVGVGVTTESFDYFMVAQTLDNFCNLIIEASKNGK